MTPNELVGRNIVRAREEIDMKQDTLAKALGITAGALSNIENGKTDITLSRVKEIAIAVKKDFYYILGYPNQVTVNNSPNTWFNNHNANFTDPQLLTTAIVTMSKATELISKLLETKV